MALHPAQPEWQSTRRAVTGAAFGALMIGAGAFPAEAQTTPQPSVTTPPVVQLTPAQCRGVAGFATDHFKASGPKSLGALFADSVAYVISPDRKEVSCNGVPILDHPICRTAPGIAAAPDSATAIKANFLDTAASYIITPDHKLAICNPTPEDRAAERAGIPTIVISTLKEFAVWGAIEESGLRTRIHVHRAVRLVADPKGDPRIPDLLDKRLKALAKHDKVSDARIPPSPR